MIIRIRAKTGQYRVEVPDGATIGNIVSAFRQEAQLTPNVQLTITLPSGETIDPASSQYESTPARNLRIVHGTILHVTSTTPIEQQKVVQTPTQKRCAHPSTMLCPNCAPPSKEDEEKKAADAIHLPEIPSREITENPELRRKQCPAHGPNSACSRCLSIPGERMKLARQTLPHSPGISLSVFMIEDLLSYIRSLGLLVPRISFLYGLIGKNNALAAQVSYDPLQSVDNNQVKLENDAFLPSVEALADSFGFTKVAVISARPEKCSSILYPTEVLFCAQQQSTNPSFALVLITPQEEGSSEASVEAFQVSQQAIHLAKNDSLEVLANEDGTPSIYTRVPVLIEGKETQWPSVEFFVVPIAIHQHKGPLKQNFPAPNRQDSPVQPSSVSLSEALAGSRSDSDFLERCCDWNLIVWLSQVLGVDTGSVLGQCVKNNNFEGRQGLRVLVESLLEM
ncbi:hypothetical protein P9112_011487 [Eukaryota sp. TZLM1-RC]